MTGHWPYDPRVSERMEEPRDPEAVPDPWKDAPRWSDSPADPWADSPAWSDGSASPEPVAESPVASDAADTPAASGDAAPTCPWCATPAAPDARRCTSCGAALAQRESIGDLVVPGLTAVDPALKDLADRPLHLSGPSPSHGVASGAIAAAAIGGPAGLAIIGGVAAVAAAEYLGASPGGAGGVPPEQVGQTSEAVLQAIEKLDRGETLPPADSTTPRPELEATDAPGHEPVNEEETADGGD
jgi:hypothetical protein